MQESGDTGQLVLAFDKSLITPAKISPKLLNWELLEQKTLEIEKNNNIIIDENSDIESVTLLRKEISNSKTKIDEFRMDIKKFLESESYELSKNLKSYIDRWEAVRKHLYNLEKHADQKRITLKKKEIEELKMVLVKSLVNKDLEQFIDDYDKWETKGCKMNTIEADIQEQINGLNSKYNSVALVIKGINEKIENKIKIEDIIHMFSKEQEHILGYIAEKEKQIRDTEDNMRKNFEKDKQMVVKETEEKTIKETEEKLKAQSETGNTFYGSYTTSAPTTKEKKQAYIFIQVNELSESVADGLIKYCQNNNIKFYLEERRI